jgi:hypothetical protein
LIDDEVSVDCSLLNLARRPRGRFFSAIGLLAQSKTVVKDKTLQHTKNGYQRGLEQSIMAARKALGFASKQHV